VFLGKGVWVSAFVLGRFFVLFLEASVLKSFCFCRHLWSKVSVFRGVMVERFFVLFFPFWKGYQWCQVGAVLVKNELYRWTAVDSKIQSGCKDTESTR
jgi:hypothetical protein